MRIPALTIDILVAVVALVKRRTYVLAGEELSLSASAVHKRVRTAENLLGRRLFIGTDEGMSLTKEGQIFYADATRTVEQALLAEERMKSFAGLDARRLLVGHSTYLPPPLLGFLMRFEGIENTTIRIRHCPGLTAALVGRVVDGTLHVAVGELPFAHPALLTRQLSEEPVVACVPKSHPLALKPLVRFEDLDDVPVIAVGREHSPQQYEEVEEYFEGSGVRLRVVADAFGPPEALHMVEQNVGICLLGASSARNSTVISKPLPARTLTRKIGVYVREDNRHPALSEFVDLLLRKATSRQEGHSRQSTPAQRRHH
ncbi:LysR family transcriptional regulator [Edaphobacter acidisoli]|uniref:LysR family transcriptional regulator n=1 Tax=Edaphobacter acidisoli TaxID=2040573 RepID=A0A916S4G2_9BACT|nr:LysR substrate-binding domain-containing protein [Edaphobacter acidisoli]GGA80294.1 LysR family transcriptional regulator [Edaphobacter acidisoli]